MLRIAWLELFNARRVQLLLALNLIFCAMPLFAQTSLNLGSPRSASSGGNAAPHAPVPASKVNWFPIQAKFAPDGSWVIVNLCSIHNVNFCRLVRWEPDGPSQPLPGVVGHWNSPTGSPSVWVPDMPSDPAHDSQVTTGRWQLIAGQAADKSYLWPAISWDGKKIAYTVADCDSRDAPGRPGTPYDCQIFAAKLAVSDSILDISSHRVLSVETVTRPAFRPDDQAVIYWRVLGTNTLASGRPVGVKSVYEFDLKSNTESPKLDYNVTRMLWEREFTGPFYATDGRTFSICGYGSDNARLFSVSQAQKCVEVEAARIGVMRALNNVESARLPTVSPEGWIHRYVGYLARPSEVLLGGRNFGVIHKYWKDGRALATLGRWAYLLNQQTGDAEVVVIDSEPMRTGTPVAIDIDMKTGNVAAIYETIWLALQPNAKRTYWEKASSDAYAAYPIFGFADRRNKMLQAVYWPDVERIDKTMNQ